MLLALPNHSLNNACQHTAVDMEQRICWAGLACVSKDYGGWAMHTMKEAFMAAAASRPNLSSHGALLINLNGVCQMGG